MDFMEIPHLKLDSVEKMPGKARRLCGDFLTVQQEKGPVARPGLFL
jgi:hypothetical protein